MGSKLTPDNLSFWNERYATLPQMGSGPSSRGYAAKYKSDLIRAALERDGVHSILDIGCGDLCWLDEAMLRASAYTGVDISDVVVAKNAAAYPRARFLVHDIARAPLDVTADLVVSLDVLIHQIERETFLAALGNMIAAISRLALISYSTPPSADGSFPPAIPAESYATDPETLALERDYEDMLASLPKKHPKMPVAFHGALPDVVRSLRPDLHVAEAGRYRRHTVYRLTRIL